LAFAREAWGGIIIRLLVFSGLERRNQKPPWSCPRGKGGTAGKTEREEIQIFALIRSGGKPVSSENDHFENPAAGPEARKNDIPALNLWRRLWRCL